MIFSELVETRMEDYDHNGRMTVKAILQLFENVGSHHSDSLDDNVIDGSQRGEAWILTEWKVRVEKEITYEREVLVETWSHGADKALLVDRDYLLKNAKGEILARGQAGFVLIDIQNGRPIRITPELVEKYGPEERDVWEGKTFDRLRQEKEYEDEKKIVLRRTDIDFNNHVHNLTYVDYVMEVVPFEAYDKNNFKEFRICYRKEIERNEEIIGKSKKIGDVWKIAFFGKDEKIRTIVEIK